MFWEGFKKHSGNNEKNDSSVSINHKRIKMNICLFSIVTYWHGVQGGMEIHGKLLAEGLAKKGHEVTIISARHPEGKEFEEKNGVKLYYLKNTTFGSRREGWSKESSKKFLMLDKVRNFDVICCQSAVVPSRLTRIEKMRKIPVVVIMEGHEGMILLSQLRQTLSHKKGFIRLIKHFLSFLYYYSLWELPLLHKYDALVGVSDEVVRSIRRWHLVGHEKMYIVYNGIETNVFRPDGEERDNIRKAYGISSDERLLLFLSHVTKQKGVHLLIRALPEILKGRERVKLIVAGDGDYLKEAKELVKKLSIEKHVIFTGHISHGETAQYINACDLFILPTVRQEGLPFALIESMACQKLVIASRIGGIPSVINDGENGLLVSPGNTDELVEKILFLLNNETSTQRLAANARRSVLRQFSVDKMIDGTTEVFEKLIKCNMATANRQFKKRR